MKYLLIALLLMVPCVTYGQVATILPMDESDQLQAQIDQLRSEIVQQVGDSRLRILAAKEEITDRLTRAREQLDVKILEGKIKEAIIEGAIARNSDRLDDIEELMGAKRGQEEMVKFLIYSKVFGGGQGQVACQPLPVNITSRRGLLGRR